MDVSTKVCRSKDIDAAELDGEKVMMNMDLGKYFALNSVGSRIWDIIEKPSTVKDIVDILLNEYDVNKSKCEESVLTYLKKLQNDNLIEVC